MKLEEQRESKRSSLAFMTLTGGKGKRPIAVEEIKAAEDNIQVSLLAEFV